MVTEAPTTIRQRDAKLAFLKSQMEIDPTEYNVKELTDEIK